MGVPIDVQNSRNNEEYYEALREALTLMWARIRYPWFWLAPVRWLYGYDQKLDHYCNVCKNLTSKVSARAHTFRKVKLIVCINCSENHGKNNKISARYYFHSLKFQKQ